MNCEFGKRVAIFLILCINGAAIQALEKKGYVLQWADEFEGSVIDENYWKVWRSKRWESMQSEDAVQVKNGILQLRTYTTDGVHYTGFISSRRMRWFTHGYVESRIRFIGAPGMWCAFWMQPEKYGEKIGDKGFSGVEVDIAEHRAVNESQNKIDNTVVFNIHWDGYADHHKQVGAEKRLAGNSTFNNEWHIFAVNWNTDGYKFYIDDIEAFAVSSAISNSPTDIRLTCEVRDGVWAGAIPTIGYGAFAEKKFGMDVDWIRVWSSVQPVQLIHENNRTRVLP